MGPAEIEARQLIAQTIARYAHCADGGKFSELAALFTPDGVLEIDGHPPLQGREDIREFLEGVKARYAAAAPRQRRWHHVSSVQIDFNSASEATARSYFLVLGPDGPDHWGRYRDTLLHSGAGWLFTRRCVRVEGRRVAPP